MASAGVGLAGAGAGADSAGAGVEVDSAGAGAESGTTHGPTGGAEGLKTHAKIAVCLSGLGETPEAPGLDHQHPDTRPERPGGALSLGLARSGVTPAGFLSPAGAELVSASAGAEATGSAATWPEPPPPVGMEQLHVCLVHGTRELEVLCYQSKHNSYWVYAGRMVMLQACCVLRRYEAAQEQKTTFYWTCKRGN